jgi:NADPH:quinone reductase-like Zn-dependent oxidoreductase
MKAIGFYQYLPVENPESLVAVEMPTPEPGERDLLVRVKAVSVNPVDVKVRSRLKTVQKDPQILGWDVAGVVERAGSDVSLFKAGDEGWTSASSGASPHRCRLSRRPPCR